MDIKEEIISKIYASYMNKKDNLESNALDAITRSPELIRQILNGLDVDDGNMKNIIVTGSKGKGSVCKILTKLFLDNGFKVGTMISPHQVHHNERIKINNQDISDNAFVTLAAQLPVLLTSIDDQLQYNKYISPMASWAALSLKHFENNKTDINILECGRGGIHDDLNFINSQVSVINNVFLEHVDQLGSTIAHIASEKIGIIKATTKTAYLGKQDDPILVPMFNKQCDATNTQGMVYGKSFHCENISIQEDHITFDLHVEGHILSGLKVSTISTYLIYNIALAVAITKQFMPQLTGLSINKTLETMDWGGYTEIISTKPTVLVDGCINKACAKYISEYIKINDFAMVTAFIAIPTSKDFQGVIQELRGICHRIVITKPAHTHHSFSENQMADLAPSNSPCTIEYSESFSTSYDQVMAHCSSRDLVIITGIQGFVGESKAYVKEYTKRKK